MKKTREAIPSHDGERFDHVPALVTMDVQALTWHTRPLQDGDIAFVPVEVTDAFRTFQARTARTDFMSIKTPMHALSFFQKYSCAWQDADGDFSWVTFRELLLVQEIVKRVTTLTADEDMYLFDDESKEFPRHLILQLRTFNGFFLDVRRKNPVLVNEFTEHDELISAFGVLAAVERVAGAVHRICARPDCQQMFEVGEQKTKIYHDPDCAHVMAMRMSRERNRRWGD